MRRSREGYIEDEEKVLVLLNSEWPRFHRLKIQLDVTFHNIKHDYFSEPLNEHRTRM